MTVVLDKDVEKLVSEHATASGGDASALVNDALRSVWSQQPPWKECPPELEAWLLEATDSPISPLTASDYDAMRARTKARLDAAAA